MASFWVPIIVLVAFLSVYLVQRLRSPLAQVPGPWLTRFTSLIIKYHEFHANRTRYIHELHKKYGNVVRLGPNEVSFASVEGMKEIYMSSGSGYDKTEFYQLFKQYNTRTMFSTLDKTEHSKRKRVLADRYANTNIMRPSSIHGIEERSSHFVQKCIGAPGKVLDIYRYLHCFAFDCATHHLFHPFGSDSIRLREHEDIAMEVSFDDSLRHRLFQYYSPRLSAALNRVITLFTPARHVPRANNFVLDAVAQSKLPAEFTLLNRLKEKSGVLQPMDMAAECMDHMAAGIETTGDALCFLMWQISQPSHIPIQRKLQHELANSSDKSFDQLPYMDAVLKESLRMYPSIPMSLPRYVPQGGKVIDGYWMPEKTIVSCQPYSLHRIDESVFPDPDEFRPERWLEEKGDVERNRLFFAFSNGGRGCTGRHLAMAEMKILLRDVYSRFTTVPAEGMTASMEMHDGIISARPKGQLCLVKFLPLEG